MIQVKKSNPLYEQIYENIKESIIKGDFKSGERIVDGWIAEKLGVSRSPVREAFRKLEQDGLLVNQDGTTLVYKPNVEDLIDLFEVRAGLEGMAIFLATKKITDEELQELEESLVRVKKAIEERNTAEVIKLNTFFHGSIVKISGNSRLQEMMGKINNLILLYRNNFFAKYYGDDVFIEEHYDLFNALKSGNAEAASEKMRLHILNDLEQLKEKLKHHQEE
ncbi:GntR family transcriptional regulator [Neobacillus sp. CF12]|uniref:GntR family transcriptional regulator n=1 Tax=Neobacillus sp. CF12 TaxID=3055864 RepID=UPI0025A00D61|nr:GntR family transcriptional regulator [Neobacillus sp. CF12]MDM5331690.1 GntR family transcriptional regulator [Neobacillus sp. CF12]